MTDAKIEKERVAEIYRKIAPSYDLWAWLTESKARDRCLELAAIRNGEQVLEVAVGTGLTFERILEANPSGRNEGIDLTDAMLIRAEKKAAKSATSNYCLRVGDAYDLDFPNDRNICPDFCIMHCIDAGYSRCSWKSSEFIEK